MMTSDDILRRIDELIALSSRDRTAAAAGAEELRTETLQAIADGALNAEALAQAALQTVEQDIGGE